MVEFVWHPTLATALLATMALLAQTVITPHNYSFTSNANFSCDSIVWYMPQRWKLPWPQHGLWMQTRFLWSSLWDQLDWRRGPVWCLSFVHKQHCDIIYGDDYIHDVIQTTTNLKYLYLAHNNKILLQCNLCCDDSLSIIGKHRFYLKI